MVVISLLHINITGSGIQNKNRDICHKRKRVETGAEGVGVIVSNGKTIMCGCMVNNGESVNDTVVCSPCDMPKTDTRARRRDVLLKVYLIKERFLGTAGPAHQPGALVCNTLLPSQSRLPPYNCIVLG